MTTNPKPHILIAGAGLGGLTLAQCLRKHNHPFTIFERDQSAKARTQGWAIALHTILADLMTSVPDDMPSIEPVNHLVPLTDRQPQLSFYDCRTPDGTPRSKFAVESKPQTEVGFGPGRIIRANRDRFREWLCTNIDVQWGKQVQSYRQDAHGVTVTFTDGTTATGDILVGAEGGKSVVRDGIIPDAPLVNVPSCAVTGDITLSKAEYEAQMRLSTSAYVVLADGFFIFVGMSKVAPDAESAEYYWDVMWHDETRAVKGPHWVDTASAEELYEFAVKKTQGIDPRYTEIIRMSSPKHVKTPPLVLRDLVLEEMPVSRVTLLGDAAHAMTPFQGEGGCNAINDAMRLARVLTTGGDLGEYQREMLKRGSSAVKASRAAGEQGEKAQTDVRKAWGQVVRPVPLDV